MTKGIGDRFQSETRYSKGSLPGGYLDWSTKPGAFKLYPEAENIPLPPPQAGGGMPLWDTIRLRRSLRRFSESQVKKEDLARLLWATQGVTHSQGEFQFRAAPSAGALYPIETYLAVHNVEGIPQGLFHYSIREHSLEQLRLGDFREKAARAALDQSIAFSCGAMFIWSAVFARSKWKYKQRAYRYVYLDAGHVAAHLSLAAVSLGLGTCQIAAFYDDEANSLLGLDGESESVIYMSAVGIPR